MIVFSYDHLENLIGLRHPMPILKTRSALIKIQSEEILKVVLNTPESIKDIHQLCQYTDHIILRCFKSNNIYTFWIEKK